MADNLAVVTAEYAASFACPSFASRSWPSKIGNIHPIDEISASLLGSGEFVFILHKDDVRSCDFAKYAAMLGRSSVAHANDVYVLFHIRSADYDCNALKSLYLKCAAINSEGPVSPQYSVKTGHFCTYVGNDVLLTETYFGRKIYVDSNDVSVSPHIAYSGEWEPHVTSFISRNLRPDDVFIDIGANCGYFTVLAAHIVGPKGFVLAVEPQNKLSELIRKSISINGFSRFAAVERAAIAEKHGEMILSQSGNYLGSASLISHAEFETGTEMVRTYPLRDIVNKAEEAYHRTIKPTMIKVDVEGFEASVWRSAGNLLDGSVTVILEFSPDRYRQIGIDPNDFLDEISAGGFSIYRLKDDGSLEQVGEDLRNVIVSRSAFTDLVLTK